MATQRRAGRRRAGRRGYSLFGLMMLISVVAVLLAVARSGEPHPFGTREVNAVAAKWFFAAGLGVAVGVVVGYRHFEPARLGVPAVALAGGIAGGCGGYLVAVNYSGGLLIAASALLLVGCLGARWLGGAKAS